MPVRRARSRPPPEQLASRPRLRGQPGLCLPFFYLGYLYKVTTATQKDTPSLPPRHQSRPLGSQTLPALALALSLPVTAAY